MDESVVSTTEGDQVSVTGKQQDSQEGVQFDPIIKEDAENEEGEERPDGKSEGDDGEVNIEDNAEEGNDLLDITPEALEAQERERKKKKREQLRLAREKLDRYYKSTDSEIETDTTEEPIKNKELDGEEGAEEDEVGTQSETVKESSQISLKEEDNLTRLKSSLALDDTEDVRTAVSSSEDESDYVRGPLEGSFKEDFLENFILPSISDLSTESSDIEVLASLRATIEETVLQQELDVGKFVNPLTGETESGSNADEVKPKEEVEEQEEEEEESSTSSEFEWPFDDDDILPIAPIVDDKMDMAMEMFLDVHQSVLNAREESTTALELERSVQQVRQIVFQFLDKVIDDAVNTAEYVDPSEVLRTKLDKEKLMDQFQKTYIQYLATKFFNADVNNKMFEYYRRVGQLRCFDKLLPKVEVTEYHRYIDAIHKYDHLTKRVDETKKTNGALLSSVRLDLEYVHNMALKSVESLETCFRETLLRKDAEFLPRVVENELRRMQQMRNEVSDSRLWLITRQHTLGRLVEVSPVYPVLYL